MALSARAAAVKASMRHGSDDEDGSSEDEGLRRPSNRRKASVVKHIPAAERSDEVVGPLLVEDLGPPEQAQSTRRAPQGNIRMRDSDSDSDAPSARAPPAKKAGSERGSSDALKTANPACKLNFGVASPGSPATSSKETPQGYRTAPSSARPSRAALRESLAPGSRLHGSALLRSLEQYSSSDEGDDRSRPGTSPSHRVLTQPSHPPAIDPHTR